MADLSQNVATDYSAIEVYRDWNSAYRYRVIASDGRTVQTSFGYPTRKSAHVGAGVEARQLGIKIILDDD